MIIYVLLAVIVVFLAVVLIRAWRFRPPAKEERPEIFLELNESEIIDHMVAMIRCKTVSYKEDAQTDFREFRRFKDLIRNLYPDLMECCTYEEIGTTGILLTWKGKSSEEPSVCMAHYDVVPVVEELWSKPAFEGIVEQGEIWGRGTLDTKGTLLSILEAGNYWAKKGFVPAHDLYFAFSGNEETGGPCCPAMVDYLQQKGVRPALVLDEGGAVVEEPLPTFQGEAAMVGIGEKGAIGLSYTLKGEGGHGATPPKHTALGELAQAVVATEKSSFPGRLTPPVKEMFQALGPHLSFGYRILFANLWCFKGLLIRLGKATGGELNAMFRTTCAMTTAEGSKVQNVLPAKASVGMDIRLLPGDTMESVKKHLARVIDNDRIEIETLREGEASVISTIQCQPWEHLKKTIEEIWPQAVVAPYLMMACSDSRHFGKISDRVYRFAPMKLSREERGMIHGHDERIPVETLVKCVKFYIRFMEKL